MNNLNASILTVITTHPKAQWRNETLKVVKDYLLQERKKAENRLLETGNGREVASNLSHLTDEIITELFKFITTHLYPSDNPSSAEKIALIATGGYGRGLMAPHSDVDLLFLLPYKQTAWGESVAEAILYFLWDLGLKVGHATRTVEECVKQAKADMTIRTSLLESRLIWGDETLFEEFQARFVSDILKDSAPNFVSAKLIERDERHLKNGGSRYMVEPNIKEGKGGLRDLHTLYWIMKYIHNIKDIGELYAKKVLRSNETREFYKSETFLWTVRCHLHFIAKRAEERLSFDYQRELATRMKYHARPGKQAVERFMQHYFLVAKRVGSLTAVICAKLEEQHEKPQPILKRVIAKLTKPQSDGDFLVENNRINLTHHAVFKENPENLVKVFALALERGLSFHPQTLYLASRHAKHLTNEYRKNEVANKAFRAIITSHNASESTLRAMNEAGILARFVPEFAKIVAMMQFSMYHSYTVDEHLLRSIGVLHEIEKGENQSFALATKLMQGLTKEARDLLYLAVFLHDIAKGRVEDHSIAGARISHPIAAQFGFNTSECDTISWLIQEHLTMSTISQQRDLQDRKTIELFAKTVQSVERMTLLTILTTADIASVGPNVWNGWKSQLLSTLFHETEPVLTGGFSAQNRNDRIAMAQDDLKRALKWENSKFDAYKTRHYPYYWLKFDLKTQKYHADILSNNETTTSQCEFDKTTNITHLTLLAPDHPRLLSLVTGACATMGANIYGASIYTTTDGLALDTIALNRAFDRDEDEIRRSERITTTIEKALKGEIFIADTVAAVNAKAENSKAAKAFIIAPEVKIDNSWSNRHTMIEVTGLDRPGLLHQLTSTLSNLQLNITSAHIATYGEKALDVFYVTDLLGGKIETATKLKRVKDELLSVL